MVHTCTHILYLCSRMQASVLLKFIFSEKATKFCDIFTLLLSTVHTVKSKLKISQNFVAFSEYMNFKCLNCMIVRRCDGWSRLWPLTSDFIEISPKNKETCLETRLCNHKLESFEVMTDWIDQLVVYWWITWYFFKRSLSLAGTWRNPVQGDEDYKCPICISLYIRVKFIGAISLRDTL